MPRCGTRIATAAQAAGRDPALITLVAVGKAQKLEPDRGGARGRAARVRRELRAGGRTAAGPSCAQRYPDVELHMIGALQSNKAAEAVALFDVIQTVDRPRSRRRWPRRWPRQGRRRGS